MRTNVLICALLTWSCQDSRTLRPTITEGAASSAPAGVDAASRDNALLRVVNLDPTQKQGEYLFNDQKVISDPAYKVITNYMPVNASISKLALHTAGQTKELATTVIAMQPGNRYTVLRMRNSINQPTLNVINDQITPPGPGNAKVRFSVASAHLGEINIAMRNGRSLQVLEPHTTGNYVELPPFRGTLELKGTAKQDGKTVGLLRDISWEAGKHYTFVILGGGAGEPLDSLVIVDKTL